MILVGTPAMRGAIGVDEAGFEIDHEEAFLRRMQAVIDDDQSARIGSVGMPAHRLYGLAQQFRSDHAIGINLGGVRRERKETEIKQDQQAAHGLSGFRACERGVDWLDGGADERRREDAGRQIRFRGRG